MNVLRGPFLWINFFLPLGCNTYLWFGQLQLFQILISSFVKFYLYIFFFYWEMIIKCLRVTQKHLQYCPPSHWEQWICSWQSWGWRSSGGSAAVGTLLSWPAWGGYGNHPPAPSAKPGSWVEPAGMAESGTALWKGWRRGSETSFNLTNRIWGF